MNADVLGAPVSTGKMTNPEVTRPVSRMARCAGARHVYRRSFSHTAAAGERGSIRPRHRRARRAPRDPPDAAGTVSWRPSAAAHAHPASTRTAMP